MTKKIISAITGAILSMFLGCSPSCQNNQQTLKVVASAVPHAEMLEYIKADLKEKKINLEIIISDDYNMPNRALAEKEVDANFFQHKPYFDEQVKQFGYQITNLATIELEPMGYYSKKIKSIMDLEDNSKIAIPNDPTNEARALFLLAREHIIFLDDPKNLSATVLNIKLNPKNLQFIEVDAAMVPRVLDDVDMAAINTNYALQAKLSPLEDALLLEDNKSPYVNILAIRTDAKERKDIEELKKALTSEKMRAFILEKYQGAVIPAF